MRSSEASGAPNCMFSRTVPENRYGFCGTRATASVSSARARSVTGTPSTSTSPDVASYSRGSRLISVDLPEPVEPMIAVVVPGATAKLTSSSTGASAPGYWKVTWRSSTAPSRRAGVTGRTGSASVGTVSRTSPMRRAEITARGSIIIMKVPIITAMRICSRYCMNAVSAPTCTSPASTRSPPNHRTAAVARWRIIVMTGPSSTNSRPIRTDVSVRAALASVNRRVSWRSRTNARTTRMPWICSRSTPLTSSMLSCIRWNSGMRRATIHATITSSTGTETHTSQDRPGSSRMAMMMPPTAMIGTATMKFRAMRVSICTWLTSLVPRVMRVAAPKRPSSSAENASTRV